MVNQDTSHIKVSLLEKIIINWATPIDGLILYKRLFSGKKINKKYNNYFLDNGILKGFYSLKIDDYKRLISASSQTGETSEYARNLYSKSISVNIDF